MSYGLVSGGLQYYRMENRLQTCLVYKDIIPELDQTKNMVSIAVKLIEGYSDAVS